MRLIGRFDFFSDSALDSLSSSASSSTFELSRVPTFSSFLFGVFLNLDTITPPIFSLSFKGEIQAHGYLNSTMVTNRKSFTMGLLFALHLDLHSKLYNKTIEYNKKKPVVIQMHDLPIYL